MEKLGRRQSRENAFLCLFAQSFQGTIHAVLEEEYPMDTYSAAVLQNCCDHQQEIDDLIVPKLKGWTLTRLPRVSLQVLRLAVAEMLYGDEDMDSVVINEAVELMRKYGDENDYQFVNGILGSIVKELEIKRKQMDMPAEQTD